MLPKEGGVLYTRQYKLLVQEKFDVTINESDEMCCYVRAGIPVKAGSRADPFLGRTILLGPCVVGATVCGWSE